jgi:hypothetical protein
MFRMLSTSSEMKITHVWKEMKEQNSNQKTNKTPVVALDRVGASKHPCA